MNKNKIIALCLTLLGCAVASAETLTLDSCRAMALRNNKQLSISRAQQEVARNVRKSVRTKYLPHVDLSGAYLLMSREISLLNDGQKTALSNIGTNAVGAINGVAQAGAQKFFDAGVLTPELLQKLQQMTPLLQQVKAAGQQQLEAYGNALGENIRDAFRTDTRNMFVGSVMLTQPIYMGGAIIAGNKMAEISERIAAEKTDLSEQNVLYDIDQAYWLVVSLNHKQKLADSYLSLVSKLDEDVQKMIKEGVATRADGLKVSVRVNEAEMSKTQAESGLSLARMLLCQLCGLPLDSDVTLADEGSENLGNGSVTRQYDIDEAIANRPETRLLSDAVEITKQQTKIARAAYLPQIALTGGYLISNPNVYNGYERKFGGVWNVGVMLRMPVLDWGDAMYKVRASKLSSNIAAMTLDETKEKLELQISQSDMKLRVAEKKLVAAQKHIQQADENLRCATVGFKEGVMSTTEVMAAQTAWFQAQSQKIDAQIDVKLSEAGLRKALGQR